MTATTKKIDEKDTPVTDKAHKMAEEALGTAAKKAGSFERKLRDESEKRSEQASELRQEATIKWDESLSEVEKYIRKRPVAAAGMAFAAGMLATLIIRR